MNNSAAKASGCVSHRGNPHGGLLRVFFHLLICMAGVLGAYQASAQEGQVTPSAPQHFEPMPGDHAVTLVWTPPLNDGGSAVTGYEYRIDGVDDWMTAGDDTVRRVTISDLNNGRLYQFEVRALNAMGAGDVAGPVTALPLGPHVEISITADTDSVEEGSPAVFTLERIFNPFGNPEAGVGTTVAISVMVSIAETEHPQGTNSTKIVTDPPMQVEFDAGQQYATLSIPTEDDSLDEYDSVVTVMVTDDNAPGYRLPDPASGRMVSASVTVMDEDPPPNVSIAGGNAPEMAGEITFAVSLDTASGLPVSVDWSTGVAATPSQGTDMATADEDYESASGTVNFPAGETEMTFRVVLIDDGLDEHREEFVVTLGNPMNAVLETETATGAIEDDDEPPTISIAGASGGESDGALMFAVSLGAPSGRPVTVDWSTDVAATPSEGSDMATADEDYESASGTLNFPAGETEMTIRVVLIDDGLDEHREEFVVTLGNPMNAVPGTETATGAIEDDDEPPTISIAGASAPEMAGEITFAVSVDTASGLPVSVDWSTGVAATPSEGSDMATADEDYESASGTLNFPAGETEMTIRVVLIDDGLDEHREEFVVTLGNPMNAVPGTETATGAIEDDDEPPTISIAGASGGESDGALMFAVSLGAPSGLPVTVDWSTDVAATPSEGADMATADEDYESASGTLNFPAGETEMTIPVVLIDDGLDEHREEFVVTLGNPMNAVPGTETATGAIEDDDEPPTISIAGASGGESDGALMFAVSLGAPSGRPVTVDWSTDVAATPSEGSDMATADEDYESASGTLNFPAGETEMTIRVVLIDDGLDEHREEFVVTLDNPMYAVPGTETATGAIEDDDEPPTISIAGASAPEMAGEITFAVSLDTASGLPVSVDWSTDVAATPSQGSDVATADEDYESASGTLNFPAGETEMTIRVVLIDDGLDEHREEFVVTLGNPMYAVPGTETATGAIEDDDEPPTISIAGASGGESDGPLMFAVSLGAPSGLPVTVDWSTDVAATPSEGSHMATAGEDYESASGTLNFPAGETEMTIRVVLIEDGLVEIREEFVVTLGNPMNAVLGTETATGVIEGDDEPTISIAGASGGESDGPLMFAVSLEAPSVLRVTVDWSTGVAATPSEGSDMATADEDYESASGTLNFPAGETEMTIRVVLIDDGLDEHREEFVVTLGNPMNAVLGTETATGAIEDDDEPPTISIAGASGGESDGPLMFAVSLDAPSGLPVTVDWSTDVAATPSQGSDMATADEDYESASGTLNFPAGETEMTIPVVLIDDGLDEHREEFVVMLGNPMYAVLGTETATGAIEDVDEPPTISIAGASGGESDGALMFAVSLGAPSGLPVTVDWSTDVAATPSEGSDMATADEDYESASGTLNFPAGETEMTIRVVLIDDGLDEHREEFVVTLGNPMYAVLGTETATGAIEDDDEPPTISIAGASGGESDGPLMFAVSLDAPSGLPVTVDWSTDVAATPSQGSDMATADEDYESASGTLNFPAGETEMTIRVVLIDDGLVEIREEFVVTLGNPMYAVLGTETATGAIEGDDEPTISIADASGGESDGPLMFAVSLGAPSVLPVTVDWSTGVAATPSEGADMATAGEDYESASGTLNFPAGETEMMIPVVLIDDGLDEHREELVVTLGNPMNAVLGTETATGAIEDDDEPPTISIAGGSATEMAGEITFAISLDTASGLPVSVDWSTGVAATPSEGSDMATADEDYESASGTLNFPAGETEMTIPVVLIDDGLDEHREEFVVTLGNPMYAVLGTETATGAIEDDDEPPTISIAGASGGESDGALMFAVSLGAPSGRPVTVDWSTDVAATPSEGSDMATADEDYESASGTLNFPAGETEMTIRVVLIDDGLDERREEFVVTLGNPMYAVLGTETATGAIEDDDEPPTLAVADTTAAESAGRIDFTVTLTGATALPATVAWATSPGTADAGDDYTTSSGSLSFAPGETSMSFSVPVVSDALYEGSETFTVTLSGSTNSTLSVATATGTITDDDAEGVVKQWLSRFGRTVADHVVEALDARLYQTPNQTASQLTLGGLRVDVDRTVGGPFGETFSLRPRGSDLGQLVAPMHSPAFNPAFDAVWDDRARRPWGSQRLRNPGVGDVLSRSSFHYGAAADGATGDAWALWGRVATTSFSGDDGVLSHDGDVTTGTVGVDFERGDALFGVALSFSEGEGEFQGSSSGLAGGNLDSSVTLVNPYVRVMINACTSVWGLVGFGGGEMTLAAGDGGVPIETDMEMTLGAAGFRVVLQHKLGNFDVATRGDAFLAQTSADAAPGLESVDADASRMRFALEATNVTELEGGGLFTPILEAGVRYDGGDAETGAGVEVGGGLRYADASGRVSLQVNARALLAHEESDYQEWGLGASVLVRPDASGQGATFNLRSTWGDIANGVDALWNGRDAGLAAAGLGTRYGARHDAEVGYGLNAPGGRNVLVPYIGVGASDIGTRDYRLGVRLRSNSTMNLSVEVDRREGFGPDPDHGVALRGWLYW